MVLEVFLYSLFLIDLINFQLVRYILNQNPSVRNHLNINQKNIFMSVHVQKIRWRSINPKNQYKALS